MAKAKLTHYVVAMVETPYGISDLSPVHQHAKNPEEAALFGLEAIAEQAGYGLDDFEGYEVGVVPNSYVTYFQIGAVKAVELTKKS